jgi:uncharacterized membrane protein
MWKVTNVYTIYVAKTEGKKLLERPKRRWEEKKKYSVTYLKETEWEVMDWIKIVQGRFRWRAFVNMVL